MRTIWLASYPKSGNTWFRMLLANLSAKDGQPVDINALPECGGIASARGPFDHLLLIDSGLLTPDEIDNLRPRVYEEIAGGAGGDEYDVHDMPPVRFVKTHDAYTLNSKGEPLMAGARGAHGAILIVRDPRDLASSLANHNHTSIDEAVDFLCNVEAAFCRKPDRLHNQFRQILPGWSGFIESWLTQRDIPVHLVRYEDMIADTAACFKRALAFAGHAASDDEIWQAVRLADFYVLREQEEKNGFRESPAHLLAQGAGFFRKGKTGGWRTELTRRQVQLIERSHADMMQRLGYEPARLPNAEVAA